MSHRRNIPCRLAPQLRPHWALATLYLAFVLVAPHTASAQDPVFASDAVTISFAPAGGDSVGRGVTVAFQNAAQATDGRAAIAIGFGVPIPPAALLGRAPNSAFNADPVNTATGNYIFDHADIAVPGRGLGLSFSRFYNSLDTTPGVVGRGWTHSYNVSLSVLNGGDAVEARWGDGHVDYYDRSNGAYSARLEGLHDTLTAHGDGTFVIAKKNQTRWHFSATGRLNAITDRNGNVVSLAYDASGRLSTLQAPGGRWLSLVYDGAGRLVTVTDPLPRSVTYGYDDAGHLVSVTDVNGGIETYTYDANGQMLTAIDPRGAVYMTNTYDAALRVVTWQADAKGNRYQFSYDSASGQTTITDPVGQTSVDAHDIRGRLIRQIDRRGYSVSYTYDDQNNRTSVTDKNGHSTTFSYDGLGNVVRKVNPLGEATEVTYDSLNNPLTRTDEQGGSTQFIYDDLGNVLSATDPLGHVTTFTYDAHGQLLNSVDPNGGVTTRVYDAAGDVVSVTDPVGAVRSFTYDASGRRLTMTDPLGRTVTTTYDGAGRILTSSDPLGQVVSHAYDANGNKTRTIDARGGVTSLAYDANNLLTTMTDARGAVTTHVYDTLDRRVSTTDARGMITTFSYDAEGHETEVTDPIGAVTRAAYDGNGNRLSATDANGRVTRYTFDPLNRLLTETDALGRVTRQSYDGLGRVVRATDAAGQVTALSYDAAGHLLQVTDPAGGTAAYTYDANGNRLTVTDPAGGTTAESYDLANRLLTSTDALGGQTLHAYDLAGNRITTTNANGTVLTFAYDALNRLAAIQPSVGAPTMFDYDAAGNRTRIEDSVGVTTYTYDSLGRVTQSVDPYGQTIAYEYDLVGNRTALIYPGGSRVTYAFDGARKMTRVTDWAGRATQYTYDLAGQLVNTLNANGTAVAAAYDPVGRLTSTANRRSDGSVVASYAYTLDVQGNRIASVQDEPLLASEVSRTVLSTFDAANQIQAAGSAVFTSDGNGNITSRTTPNGATIYGWDSRDWLVQVGDGATAVQYVYNGIGTRLAKRINGVATRFVVDTQPTLSQVLVETNDAGEVLARYVYGLGLIARVDASGAALTYHFDPRGSTVAMTDAAQAIVNRYVYDEFGDLLGEQAAESQPFGYVGQFGVMMEPHGLLFMRARYMAPADGRFLSRDVWPANGDNQSLHRYSYAASNPVSVVDPLGLFGLKNPATIGIGALQVVAGVAVWGGWVTNTLLDRTAGAASVVPTLNESSRQFEAAWQNLHGGEAAVFAGFRPSLVDDLLARHPTVDALMEAANLAGAVQGIAALPSASVLLRHGATGGTRFLAWFRLVDLPFSLADAVYGAAATALAPGTYGAVAVPEQREVLRPHLNNWGKKKR
jgi:RHS repeat-associated protein